MIVGPPASPLSISGQWQLGTSCVDHKSILVPGRLLRRLVAQAFHQTPSLSCCGSAILTERLGIDSVIGRFVLRSNRPPQVVEGVEIVFVKDVVRCLRTKEIDVSRIHVLGPSGGCQAMRARCDV